MEQQPIPGLDNLAAHDKAEAFLNLATSIPENTPPVNAPQGAPTPVEESQMAGIQMGPKYLDALDRISSLNDTKSFEIQLPIMDDFAEVSPITGVDEQSLKTASVTPETFLKKLNEILFAHTTLKQRGKTSFREFLENLYPPDKAATILALLISSYSVLPTIEKQCESCKKEYIIEEPPANLVHRDSFTQIWDKPLPPADYTETQTSLGGTIIFEFGMPSEADRIIIASMLNPGDLKANVENNESMFDFTDTLVYFIRSITVGVEQQQIVLTHMSQDIYPFIKNLTPKLKDRIRSDVDLTMFDKYMPDFYLETTCKHCSHQEKVSIDPEITFFRKTISV